MFYFVKTPGWLKLLYKRCTWQLTDKDKVIYLTFDDGPHPVVTPLVLDTLKAFDARATFFCIGKNVVAEPTVYTRILEEGHGVGNHTFNHLNGFKTPDRAYIGNIIEAKKYIDSRLFRPPYGRITPFQLRLLAGGPEGFTVVMWSVLSGDFDTSISKEKCLENVLLATGNGSIVVFHDSEKARERMQYALPAMLEYFSKKGYRFEKIGIL